MLYRFTLTLTKKTSFTIVFRTELCLPSSSFRPWVPDLNLNKSLEPISETPCKYFLHSKSSVNSLYTHNLLFLHIPECKLLITKFLNALLILDTASLEPSEVEVRSISLIVSKTQFLPLLSLSTWNFTFIPFFFEKFFFKNYPYLFSIILKTKILFSYFSLNLKAQYLNHPIQLHCKSLRSNL